MKRILPILLFCSSGLANPLAYLYASSEEHDGKPRSYVYNLIDGKDGTAWCAKPGAENQALVYGLKKATQITKVTIVPGILKDGDFDGEKRSARHLLISDGTTVRDIELARAAEAQEIKLDPPVHAEEITITISETHGPSDAPLCIPRLDIWRKGANLSSGMHQKVRSLSTSARKLVHRWTDNVDAPEKTLLLAIDGTFTFHFEPLLEGKPLTIRGTWRGGRRKLRMESRGKSGPLSPVLSEVDDGDGVRTQLTLSGKGLSEHLAGDYQPAPPPSS